MTEMRHQGGSSTPQGTPADQSPVPGSGPAEGMVTTSQATVSAWRTIAIAAAGVVVVAILLAIVYGLVSHPVFTAVLSDIAIIVLALTTMVTCIFLTILLFQVQSLTVLLRDEIRPMLKSMNETAGTVAWYHHICQRHRGNAVDRRRQLYFRRAGDSPVIVRHFKAATPSPHLPSQPQ